MSRKSRTIHCALKNTTFFQKILQQLTLSLNSSIFNREIQYNGLKLCAL